MIEYLEHVKDGARVETRLLVGRVEERALGTLVGKKGGVEIKLEALGNLVLELDGGAEGIRGSPGLGEGETVGLVGELGLDVTVNVAGFCVTGTSNFEGDVGGGGGFHLKRSAMDVVVLAEEVVGGLAKVLRTSKKIGRDI